MAHIKCVGVYKQGQVQAPNGALFISRVVPDRSQSRTSAEPGSHPEHIPPSSATCLSVFLFFYLSYKIVAKNFYIGNDSLKELQLT